MSALLTRASSRVETIALEGELGEQEWAVVQEDLFRQAHRGRFQVVLDFSEVAHLDYRGVRPLMSRVELFRRAGGDIKLAGLSPYLQAILRAAGAHEAFEIFATAEDAAFAFTHGSDF